MEGKKIVNVTNRSNGMVAYTLPEKNLTRTFGLRETKKIPYEEIEQAMSIPGGRELFMQYLLISDPTVVEDAINLPVEKEYYMTEDEIKEWMHSSSLPEFQDALDFAPTGVKDLIKKYAVELPLNDMNKREALKEQLHFDVTAAVQHVTEEKEGEEIAATPQRRVQQPENATAPAGRRITIVKPEK